MISTYYLKLLNIDDMARNMQSGRHQFRGKFGVYNKFEQDQDTLNLCCQFNIVSPMNNFSKKTPQIYRRE
jgi:hypothetical protein